MDDPDLRHLQCQSTVKMPGRLEDALATDLGAERSRDGEELKYVRPAFTSNVSQLASFPSMPYTWTDDAGTKAEARYACKLGYTAKSAVNRTMAVINEVSPPLLRTSRKQSASSPL